MLVAEMPGAGKDHGKVEAIGSRDDIRIVNGAAGLDYGGGAVFCGFFYAIGERKERIGTDHGSSQREHGFHGGDFDRIDPAHLPRADADGLSGARKYNGIGFDVLRDFPGELERG